MRAGKRSVGSGYICPSSFPGWAPPKERRAMTELALGGGGREGSSGSDGGRGRVDEYGRASALAAAKAA